jgi:hypothetical protein
LTLEYDWIICTYCEQPAHFNAGTLVVKDGDVVREVIGICCAEKFLRELLEKGPKWLEARR